MILGGGGEMMLCMKFEMNKWVGECVRDMIVWMSRRKSWRGIVGEWVVREE